MAIGEDWLADGWFAQFPSDREQALAAWWVPWLLACNPARANALWPSRAFSPPTPANLSSFLALASDSHRLLSFRTEPYRPTTPAAFCHLRLWSCRPASCRRRHRTQP